MKRSIVRSGMAVAVAAVVSAGLVACDDDGPVGPRPIPLAQVAGVYEPLTFTFDPQGAAPAGDVLDALEASGYDLELNISQVGTFQILYRDPVTGEARIISGQVEPRPETIELVFASQSAADQLLLPQRVELLWNAEDRALSFSGMAAVNRARLQQLFPELYGDEPWTTQTIPGTLTISFQDASLVQEGG